MLSFVITKTLLAYGLLFVYTSYKYKRFWEALMTAVFNVLFYGVIIVGALLFFGLAYYRIDWARHPEKYKKDVENYEKEKEANKRAAQQAAMQRVIDKKNGQKASKKEKKPTTFLEKLDYQLKHRHDKR